MKRKTILFLGFSYLALIAVILIFGLGMRKTRSSSSTETLISPDTPVDEAEAAASRAATELSPPALTRTLTPVFETDTKEGTSSPTESITERAEAETGVPTWTFTTAKPDSTRTPTKAAYPLDQTLTITPEASKTQTRSPVNTSTVTTTPEQQTGWEGEWTVWFEQEDGAYISGEITINISATDLAGNGILGGIEYTFEGFAPDEWRVHGSWTSSSNSGSFIWEMLSDGQFGGRRDGSFGFCGVRPGLTKPDPCFIPIIS